MDCREFRKKHVAYVDDLLPVVEMDAMQRHVANCARCSRQDIMVRRSLMLVRSLPSIEPSPDFRRRLNERLQHAGREPHADSVIIRPSPSSVGAFAALAAGVMIVAYMALQTTRYYVPEPLASTGPVATFREASLVPSMSNAALVASVPTGMPVWPAVVMAGQAPLEFATLVQNESDPAR